MTPTEQCRLKARWQRSGETVYYRPRFIYGLPCAMRSLWLFEYPGSVQLRADCRWTWWRWKSKWHKGWTPGQGVADNQ